MEWEKYSEKFTFTAEKNGYTQDTIDSLLNYAKKLYDQDLPIIFDQRHLSLLVGYKEDFLYKVSNSAHSFYRKFKIPKKSGGMRNIAEPLPSLKEIQYWILNEILYKCSVSRFAKAYVIDRSIRENARFHINQTVVLTIDIKDFFPSLSIKNVYSFFKNLGYSPAVSTMLANLCCLNKSLPQGAPTSPALSNLLMIKVDKRIAGFIKKHNIRYTRYADDMTFSGDFNPGMVVKFVKKVLIDSNLEINNNKIRVRKHHQRQEVTGITVNQKLQASRNLRKKLRQSFYYIEKYGLASHLERIDNPRANHLYHLLGIATFILFINPEDKEVQKIKEELKKYLVKK